MKNKAKYFYKEICAHENTKIYCRLRPLLKKSRCVSRARIYVQAQNLLTWTKFSGLDPESTSNVYKAQYPMSRQYTMGVEITF